MTFSKNKSLIFIVLLLVALIGIVAAFWASGILVRSDDDPTIINVGLAKEVETDVTLSGGNADNLVPIGTIPTNPDTAVEYVIIPLVLFWTEIDSGFASGLKATFTISPTIMLNHNAQSANSTVFDEALELINIHFILSQAVEPSHISESLNPILGSSAAQFYDELQNLDENVATNSFDIELTIEVPKTIYLVAFIDTPDENTYAYINQSIIKINLNITAKAGQTNPVPIIPIENIRFKTIAGGGFTTGSETTGDGFSVAIDIDGNLWSWGRNNNGQQANGTWGTASSYDVLVPTKITNPSIAGITFKHVAAGVDNVVAIDTDGNLWGWGSNTNYGLGTGSTTARYLAPTKLPASTTFIDVALGQNFGIAICVDEKLWSWGYSSNYQTGNGTTAIQTPTKIPESQTYIDGKRFKSIDAGNSHAIALDTDGKLYGWGQNANGQTGIGSVSTNVSVPTPIIPNTTFSQVAIAMTGYSLALDIDGQMWSWGANSGYFLGNGNNTSTPIPASRTDKNTVVLVEIMASCKGGMAIDNMGGLWSWGSNNVGTLGPIQPADTYIKVPTKLYETSPAYFVALNAGSYHMLALDITGRIWVTGHNTHGQLGTNTPEDRFGFVILDLKKRLD